MNPRDAGIHRIVVDRGLRSQVRDAFFDWRRSQGATIVTEPPESAGIGNTIVFSQVPAEFLAALDASGIRYSIE